MKKETGNRIKLGLFITIALAFFMVGIFYVGQKQRLFTSTFDLHFKCSNVNGLQAGNNVRFSGITVGTVESIDIVADTIVQVTLKMDKSVKKFIKQDSQAAVGSEGLMGDKIVNITPGSETNKEVEDGAFIQCTSGSSIEEIMTQVKVVASNAAVVTYDLAAITESIRMGQGTIGKLFMDSSMAVTLDQSLNNVEKGTAGFAENMEAAKHNFLLRGYYKKKAKAEEERLDSIQKKQKSAK